MAIDQQPMEVHADSMEGILADPHSINSKAVNWAQNVGLLQLTQPQQKSLDHALRQDVSLHENQPGKFNNNYVFLTRALDHPEYQGPGKEKVIATLYQVTHQHRALEGELQKYEQFDPRAHRN